MKTKLITIKNCIHNTKTTARVEIKTTLNGEKYSTLSAGQIRRIWSDLCGISGCSCAGYLGARGPQDGFAEFEYNIDGTVDVFFASRW